MVLSIIIPAYNAEKYICQCLDSVIEQCDNEMEIIIINDGSSDNTDIVCREYIKKYSIIKYYYQDNQGVSCARNLGIEKASGNWITFLDADDMIQKKSLSFMKRMDLSGYEIILTGYDSNLVEFSGTEDMNVYDISSEIMKKAILNLPRYHRIVKSRGFEMDGTLNWTCWGKFYKRDFLIRNNIRFATDVRQGEDYLFCYKAYSYIDNIGSINIKTYYYRYNERSLSHKYDSRRIENMLLIISNFIKMDDSILRSIDFSYFIVGRIVACCLLYFSHEDNNLSLGEKTKELEQLCCLPYIKNAIDIIRPKKMCVSKKRNIQSIIVFSLIKKKKYKDAIKMSIMLRQI